MQTVSTKDVGRSSLTTISVEKRQREIDASLQPVKLQPIFSIEVIGGVPHRREAFRSLIPLNFFSPDIC